MKSARILSVKRIAAFAVSICLFGAASPIAAAKSGDRHSRKALSSTVVATVNNASITQADVDTAVAASGERDTLVLRRAVKHKLIALELLRQAAGRYHYMRSESAAQRGTQAERSVVSIQLYLRDAVRPAPVTDGDVSARYMLIISSLRALTYGVGDGIRGVAQVSAEMSFEQYDMRTVSAESSLISDKGSHSAFYLCDLPVTRTPWGSMHGLVGFGAVTSMQTHGLEAFLYSIRQQLQSERFDEAIRAVVENLMARSSIRE